MVVAGASPQPQAINYSRSKTIRVFRPQQGNLLLNLLAMMHRQVSIFDPLLQGRRDPYNLMMFYKHVEFILGTQKP
jgi:hypothetical protein